MHLSSTTRPNTLIMLFPLLLLLLATSPTQSSSLLHRHEHEQPRTLSTRSRRLADRSDLVTMIPQQSCYYQGYNHRLTCNCNSTDTAAYLHLKMKYYVSDRNPDNDIRAVYLQQCKELVVVLDLQRVDATRFPIHFKSIMKVNNIFIIIMHRTLRAHVFSKICVLLIRCSII